MPSFSSNRVPATGIGNSQTRLLSLNEVDIGLWLFFLHRVIRELCQQGPWWSVQWLGEFFHRLLTSQVFNLNAVAMHILGDPALDLFLGRTSLVHPLELCCPFIFTNPDSCLVSHTLAWRVHGDHHSAMPVGVVDDMLQVTGAASCKMSFCIGRPLQVIKVVRTSILLIIRPTGCSGRDAPIVPELLFI